MLAAEEEKRDIMGKYSQLLFEVSKDRAEQ